MITGIGEYLIENNVPPATIFLILCLLLVAIIVLLYLSAQLDKKPLSRYPQEEIPPHIKKILDDCVKSQNHKNLTNKNR